MAFPYAFHANFETGTKDAFDSESDSGNRLDFPGPQQLVHDMLAVFPHRGAYCMRVNLGKNSTDAYVSETVSWAADSTNYMRFEFMVGEDVQVGNDGDLVDIMALDASGNEGAICLSRIEPAGLVLGVRDTSGSVTDYLSVEPGDWVCIEAQVDVDNAANNDGSIIVWIGNDRLKLSNLDQAAITAVRFGAMNQTGDFTGHIYFDEIVFDDARLYPDYAPHNLRLDGETMAFFKSGFAFVGKGHIMGCQLVGNAAGNTCTLKVYDTDDVNFSETMKKEHLTVTTANGVSYSQALGDGPLFNVDLGCYVELSGTDAQALIRMGMVDELALDDVEEELELEQNEAA